MFADIWKNKYWIDDGSVIYFFKSCWCPFSLTFDSRHFMLLNHLTVPISFVVTLTNVDNSIENFPNISQHKCRKKYEKKLKFYYKKLTLIKILNSLLLSCAKQWNIKFTLLSPNCFIYTHFVCLFKYKSTLLSWGTHSDIIMISHVTQQTINMNGVWELHDIIFY